MDLEYDRKFDEMKKYIPFLESMINRLESTTDKSSANPRQAQLDKIRSLRDLLLDKKKRMKMENLLKCEQVLVNLYAKVEQRDTLPGIKKPSDPSFQSKSEPECPSLDVSRNKLKLLTSKIKEEPDTLPEIARACEEEVVCTPGSKEPALFQRRPNKISPPPTPPPPPRISPCPPSPPRILPIKSKNSSPKKSVPKRNYTRVLVSPEPETHRWTGSGNSAGSEKPLYVRRSPKKSPNKKDKKKSSKHKKFERTDLNITLNVPEESLSSFNQRDILSRIIECPNDDVDIETLCDVKAQILRELKQGGSNEDISDLILKSYKVKKKKKVWKKTDVEEGELSDSESEAINSIYGSLVVVDKDKAGSEKVKSSTSKTQRKVQICLVLNSEKEHVKELPKASELDDLEMYDDNKIAAPQKDPIDVLPGIKSKQTAENVPVPQKDPIDVLPGIEPKHMATIDDDKADGDEEQNEVCLNNATDVIGQKVEAGTLIESPFKANFYKPISIREEETKENVQDTELNRKLGNENKITKVNEHTVSVVVDIEPSETSVENRSSIDLQPTEKKKEEEIPLLNTDPIVPPLKSNEDVVSEIEILQALKNEILSESIALPKTDKATPALHQPKLTKVASAAAINTKKRISIEKYKEKSVAVSKPLFVKQPKHVSLADGSKKQSLKLTEAECERFNFPAKLALDDSSEDEDDVTSKSSEVDVYGGIEENMAPKSPENNDKLFAEPSSPVIIPEDPVKPPSVNSKTDIDMRNVTLSGAAYSASLPIESKIEQTQEPKRPVLLDPRVNRDVKNSIGKGSPNVNIINPEGTPRHFPNMTPTLTRPYDATPSHQPFEMTPSRQNIDIEDNSRRGHVYAPFPILDYGDKSVTRDDSAPHWEPNNLHSKSERDTNVRREFRNEKNNDRTNNNPRNIEQNEEYYRTRYGWIDTDECSNNSFGKSDAFTNSKRNNKQRAPRWEPNVPDSDKNYGQRSEIPMAPNHPFGRSDAPMTPSHPFGTHNNNFGRSDASVTPSHPYGRSDAPMTPSHPYGRSDAPMTPSHPFGRSEAPVTNSYPFSRSDMPMTPSHPFGRSDAPMTPSHPFGRSDAPMTPSHPFGRSDTPMTPSHSFGRSDAPLTPSHPFGRSDAPMTPSHTFGRSDAPRTPNHYFGRSEVPRTPSHSFGRHEYVRSDSSQSSAPKDPRLNRTIEYDSRRYGNDRDREYQNDRSEISNRNYGRSNSSYTKEYSADRLDRNNFGYTSYREHKERTFCRDNVSGNTYSRNDDFKYNRDRFSRRHDHYENRENLVRSETSKDLRRATSVGRFERDCSRAPSVGRTLEDTSNMNTLSVKPQSGRSFTIDTSVNSTFQKFLSEKGLRVLEPCYDSRRSRATSVGRTLTRESSEARNYRESSVTRSLTKSVKERDEDTSGYKKMVEFVRAKSMSRDISSFQKERSLKDIKADLKSFSSKELKKYKWTAKDKFSTADARSRKDIFIKQQTSHNVSTIKNSYSPRKNNRDPRIRKDYYNTNSKSYDKNRVSGIVYSNDNIAKGAILGPGYDVKNYKIPKIKRPMEEKEDTTKHEITKDNTSNSNVEIEEKVNKNVSYLKSETSKSNRKIKEEQLRSDLRNESIDQGKKTEGKKVDKNYDKKDKLKTKDKHIKDSDAVLNKNAKAPVEELKNTEKKSKKAETEKQNTEHDKEIVFKARKHKKAIVDSDSDNGHSTNYSKHENIVDSNAVNVNVKEQNDESVDSSFGIDDLEIFSENIVADPVMANINALIADLDNDIDTSNRSDVIDFTDVNIELAFDKMLEKGPHEINDRIEPVISPKEQLIDKNSNKNFESKSLGESNSVHTSYCIENSTNVTVTHDVSVVTNEKDNTKINKHEREENLVANSQQKQPPDVDVDKTTNTSEMTENSKSDTHISTTLTEKKEITKDSEELIDERCSTPDSTIIINEVVKNSSSDNRLPDSTFEKTEMHSDVTSTHDLPETSLNNQNDTQQIQSGPSDSMGSLLAILKDKSKIRELLNMLGDESSENDKIKKTLEKISEIVSDEDKPQVSNVDNKTDEIENLPEKASHLVMPDEMPKAKNDISKMKEIDVGLNNSESNTKAVSVRVTSTSLKSRKTVGKKNRKGKNKNISKKNVIDKEKRLTRASAANVQTEKSKPKKKPSRELKLLQESIKEMFISDDILNATGIRMCRLAKLVDDKDPPHEDTPAVEPKPVVVLEKFKDKDPQDVPKVRKKPGPKPKICVDNPTAVEKAKANKPVSAPKSKLKLRSHRDDGNDGENDPYSFEDSISETTRTSDAQTSSDSDSESLASSKSFGSTEALAELKKKPKRKRRGAAWSSGIIKSKKRKKVPTKQVDQMDTSVELEKDIIIPDFNCYTDKTYSFGKDISSYSCRLCNFKGFEIVKHYKSEHPHSEIPLSRMIEKVAREAIEQCEDIDFQALRKMSTERYVCSFCFEEFSNKKNNVEEFFWHVVSMHTGEYKHSCLECVGLPQCSFNPEIPAPPKDLNGQLIGYVCGKCNYTQIALENLKSHVIVRHNDEQTAVYTVNLSVMNKKEMKLLMKRVHETEKPRQLRSSRGCAEKSNQDSENVDQIALNSVDDEIIVKNESDELPIPKSTFQSKIVFESDDAELESPNSSSSTIKLEKEDDQIIDSDQIMQLKSADDKESAGDIPNELQPSDIFDYPHFKITYNSSGCKEYVCCINGKDNHYKTSLLISMKKHVQLKHTEAWDGYCFICKVIVVPQGLHPFKECLQHLLDTHIDNLPVLKQYEHVTNSEIRNEQNSSLNVTDTTSQLDKTSEPAKSYINVRPLSALISEDVSECNLPRIESVVSLGLPSNETQESSINSSVENLSDNSVSKPPTPATTPLPKAIVTYKYEEVQAAIMSKKHRVILEEMMNREKLVHIFKCSGVYCSYTTDSAEAAILHASTHQRIGGENTLICPYCDFDCNRNAIELVMHVFKMHGRCQYVCGHCFYRAVASQLVYSHISRAHGEDAEKLILQTDTVAPAAEDAVDDILPREVAVQQFVCINLDNQCKFKTYTHGKFIEHCTKHTAPYYLCHICLNPSQTPVELTQHMKVHGFRVYQCTWCIEGGDSETEFIAHTSLMHPNKEPQAYLRLTRNNKVLPLAKFSNAKTFIPITPGNKAIDPVRMAEKALDLEKMIQSMPLMVTETVQQTSEELQSDNSKTSQNKTDESVSDNYGHDSVVKVPPRRMSQKCQLSDQTTLTLLPVKTEPVEKPTVNIQTPIVCLDSDDEEPAMEQAEQPVLNIIDITDDDSVIIPFDKLYKCPQCKVTFKNATGFKLHLHRCLQSCKNIKCAHCSFTTQVLNSLCDHYNRDHRSKTNAKDTRSKNIYTCAVCNMKETNINILKGHIRQVHGLQNLSVTRKEEQNEIIYYVNGVLPKPKQLPKRKLSDESAESSTKRMRFSPQDLDKIPQKPILDHLTYCSECEFSTKVRLNLVRHFQQHAEAQTVPQTAPVNPVPHLETNEMHFDKMINLASSSLESTRDKDRSVVSYLPPEVVARYPVFVPDRQRNTCGAKGCTYTSVDELMLKCHWETLHAGSNEFICVHCPPTQQWDTSKPFTTARIITHLKMHDTCLYACSSCPYYHFKKQVLEKHVAELHRGGALLVTVREEGSNPVGPGVSQPTGVLAPTMDLKPWKCGLCAFKSMLLPEVVEHCFKLHNAKMQYKCPVCPFRTSTLENVTKHKANSHPDNKEDVFYYYYREGSIPDESDGTPRWVIQQAKLGIQQGNNVVKIDPEPVALKSAPMDVAPKVNLDIVKKEVETFEDLCKKFNYLCDPAGSKYICPLCKLVQEENAEVMQSHLYEELQYRKWGCTVCPYKAFHKTGLNEHMATEHKQHKATDPILLPVDPNVEKWVTKALDHQTAIMNAHKLSQENQKVNSAPLTSNIELGNPDPKPTNTSNKNKKQQSEEINKSLVIKTFGDLGAVKCNKYCCPKCEDLFDDENKMKLHLQKELDNLRWCCSLCSKAFQNYHETQLHAKSCHEGGRSKPVPMSRSSDTKEAWIVAVISAQKQNIFEYLQPAAEDPLLAVRYEEDVSTPEAEKTTKKKRPQLASDGSDASSDSDNERLIIDETTSESHSSKVPQKCNLCSFATVYSSSLKVHTLKHYNLLPYQCTYCDATFYKYNTNNHFMKHHPDLPQKIRITQLPAAHSADNIELSNKTKEKKSGNVDKFAEKPKNSDGKALELMDKDQSYVCYVCEKLVYEKEKKSHLHDKPTYFGQSGDTVLKCTMCLDLLPTKEALSQHYKSAHPNNSVDYAFYKLFYDNRVVYSCELCKNRCQSYQDFILHHNLAHFGKMPKFLKKQELEFEGITKNDAPPSKKVARKSTTRLPSQTVARKSTSKLPFYTNLNYDKEYSFYGTRPIPLHKLSNITALVPVCGSVRSLHLKMVSEIMDVAPIVKVKDCNEK